MPAVQFGQVGVIKLLRNAWGQALLEKDNDGWLPLHHAARWRKMPVEVVRYLVHTRPHALRHKDKAGRLPLHVALQFGEEAASSSTF